jgi:AcrR family transcriptional regulator
MTDETDLPPDVAVLWRLREVPRRGPRPTLTVDDIVEAAIDVADADGLGALSMAAVAARLGNSTMALYRHVRSKDELLLLMVDGALEDPAPFPEDADWRAKLRLWVRDVLTVLRKHRWYAHIPVSGPPVGPRNLAWFDRALEALEGTGLAAHERVGVVTALLTQVHGQIRLSADMVSEPGSTAARYGEVLTRVVDPARFPALSGLLASGVFDDEAGGSEAPPGQHEMDADFFFGVDLYLDGLADLVARRAAEPVPG